MNQKITASRVSGLLLVALFLLNSIAMQAKPVKNDELPSLKGKKVLMVWGGWNGHFPKELTEKVKAYLDAQGAIVTVSDSLGVYTNKKIMDETDLIFQSFTMAKITPKQEKGLLEAVKRGVGIAGTHGGLFLCRTICIPTTSRRRY